MMNLKKKELLFINKTDDRDTNSLTHNTTFIIYIYFLLIFLLKTIILRMGGLSIAVIPTSLSFSEEKTKNVLTLYNQNPFPIKFKVRSHDNY